MQNIPIITYSFLCFGSTVGFNFYWMSFLILLYCFYILLSVVDVWIRVFLEYRKKNIQSSRLWWWIIERAWKSILVFTVLILWWHLIYVIPTRFDIVIWLTPIVCLVFFVLEELSSIVENLTEITPKRRKTLLFIKSILNLWLFFWIKRVKDHFENEFKEK